MDPLAVSAYGAEQALPLIGTGTGTGGLLGKWVKYYKNYFFKNLFIPSV